MRVSIKMQEGGITLNQLVLNVGDSVVISEARLTVDWEQKTYNNPVKLAARLLDLSQSSMQSATSLSFSIWFGENKVSRNLSFPLSKTHEDSIHNLLPDITVLGEKRYFNFLQSPYVPAIFPDCWGGCQVYMPPSNILELPPEEERATVKIGAFLACLGDRRPSILIIPMGQTDSNTSEEKNHFCALQLSSEEKSNVVAEGYVGRSFSTDSTRAIVAYLSERST